MTKGPLINDRTGECLVQKVEIADTIWTRTKGLLGRKSLEEDRALWIRNCNSIHTFFMHFAIDVIYLDGKNQVVKIVTEISPWRMSYSWRADSVIEFAAGVIKKGDVRKEDLLKWEE